MWNSLGATAGATAPCENRQAGNREQLRSPSLSYTVVEYRGISYDRLAEITPYDLWLDKHAEATLYPRLVTIPLEGQNPKALSLHPGRLSNGSLHDVTILV